MLSLHGVALLVRPEIPFPLASSRVQIQGTEIRHRQYAAVTTAASEPLTAAPTASAIRASLAPRQPRPDGVV